MFLQSFIHTIELVGLQCLEMSVLGESRHLCGKPLLRPCLGRPTLIVRIGRVVG